MTTLSYFNTTLLLLLTLTTMLTHKLHVPRDLESPE